MEHVIIQESWKGAVNKFKNISEEEMRQLAHKDPSNDEYFERNHDETKAKNQYLEVIAKWYSKGQFSLNETHVKDVLEQYDYLKRRNKLKPEHKNIDRFRFFDKFARIVDGYVKENDIITADETGDVNYGENVKKIYDEDGWQVWETKTYKATYEFIKYLYDMRDSQMDGYGVRNYNLGLCPYCIMQADFWNKHAKNDPDYAMYWILKDKKEPNIVRGEGHEKVFATTDTNCDLLDKQDDKFTDSELADAPPKFFEIINSLDYHTLDDIPENLYSYLSPELQNMAQERYEKKAERMMNEFQEDIEAADLEHVNIYYDLMDYEGYGEFDDRDPYFSFTSILTVGFSGRNVTKKANRDISEEAKKEIEGIMEDYYVGEHELPTYSIEFNNDELTIDLGYLDGMGAEFESVLHNAKKIEDNYDELYFKIVVILGNDGVVDAKKYTEYIKTFDMIEKEYENDISRFQNIELIPFDDLSIEAKLMNFNIQISNEIEKSYKMKKGIHVVSFNKSNLGIPLVNSIIKAINYGKRPYYDPRQLLLKNVLPPSTSKFTSKEIDDISKILYNASGVLTFYKTSDEEHYALKHIMIDLEICADIKLMLKAFQTLDLNYDEFNELYMDELNKFSVSWSASLIDTSKAIKESFVMMINRLTDMLTI